MDTKTESLPQAEPAVAGQVSVEEASNIFAAAGVPRSPRTIRRYCQRGVLICTRMDTENNQEQYLIERASVANRGMSRSMLK